MPFHAFAGKRGIAEAKTVENGSVDEVEIVNVTSNRYVSRRLATDQDA